MSFDLPGMGGDFTKTGASGAGNVYDTSPTGLGLSPAYLAPGAVASASGFSGTLPSGSIIAYGGAVAPAGYVLCDGSTYDGTQSTYSNLWTALGVTYGGSGQSAFKVPDLQGRIPVGKGTNASVNALGTNDGQSVANRRPHHRTTVTDPGHSHNQQTSNGAGGNFTTSTNSTGAALQQNVGVTGTNTTGITAGTGNANDALDTPSFIVINYIIAL